MPAPQHRDDTLNTSRIGHLVTRKYYKHEPELRRLIAEKPSRALEVVRITNDALAIAKTFETLTRDDMRKPVINRGRGERIKAFIDDLIVSNAGPKLKDELKNFRLLLVLSALNGDDYLTFGDVIRLQSGQWAWKTQNSKDPNWLNYLKHYNRKLNPNLVKHAEALTKITADNFEEILALFIQHPALFAQFIEYSTGQEIGDEELAALLAVMALVSQDPALMESVKEFLQANEIDLSNLDVENLDLGDLDLGEFDLDDLFLDDPEDPEDPGDDEGPQPT